MTSGQSQHPNPPFQTPQPADLQSPESREAVLQRVSDEQSDEQTAGSDSQAEKPKPGDAASLLENMDNLENRHLTNLDSPPG